MLVAYVLLGVVSAVRDRERASTQEFLLGCRNMPPIAVAFSLLGGSVSAISILGNPTEIYFHGTQLSTTLLGFIPAVIVMHQITIPIFYNLKMFSIAEYLELRYGSAALRKMGTTLILMNFCVYMGMCLYAPALALATVTNISPVNSIVIVGVIVTFYITIGGVKAVVYTDVMQTVLMFGGVLAVVMLCCMELGGVEEVWAIAKQGGRLEFFNLDTDLHVRHTFWSTVCFGFFLGINFVAIEQSVYQRLASVRSLSISRRLAWFFLAGLWCLWIMFFFSGLVAYATYSTCDPFTSGKIKKPDQIIPFLVTDKLGHIPGLSGVFVAAVYGGVLSSLSSAANSAACVAWQDFLKPLPYFSGLKESSAMHIIKALSCFTGILAIGVGILVGNLGNIFHVINSLNSAIAGPLKGLFLAGMLLPWVNTKGAVMGLLVSFCFSIWLVVGKFLNGGGSPPQLPLSVDGCPVFSNYTLDVFTTIATTPVASTIFPEHMEKEKSIYDISYCYSGTIAFLITMVFSAVVALLTEPTRPEELREGVVNPTCERLYRRLYNAYNLRTRTRVSCSQEPTEMPKDGFKMLPQSDTNLHSPQ
ncbi:sodium-coupled monocarboxylate transporter 1-like isoform X2 [Scylla paramamosain]|uniref:sodium-coupled monocarboxylate transporter 1-like isoform X2 n=1 Tax=Scylla paramamosain TaxID=85552 RepID=UPI00308375CE